MKKINLQFAKLVFEKHGYGSHFTGALAAIAEDGDDVAKIRNLVLGNRDLHRHQILLYKGDMDVLRAYYGEGTASSIVRDLVAHHCAMIKGIEFLPEELNNE